MQTTIQKWGNSQAIRLPKAILETAQLGENETVQIFAEQDKIIIKRANIRKHRTLTERLEGWTGEYVFEEWDTGAPVGREIL
ncbi:MAG: AbrB/MazE/SpoVT family DNA-binding domain-containing protein [Oscillospiraceae bacterium]|nr:AbrB/MazE/SpoVT family DNA-binding domain-containing protein [Oscillospiraceae bacterium]